MLRHLVSVYMGFSIGSAPIMNGGRFYVVGGECVGFGWHWLEKSSLYSPV